MTPKEKAKELVHKMLNIDSDSDMFDNFIMKEFYAQRAALIAVDEMLEFTKRTEVSSLTVCTPDGCFRDETTYYNDYLIDVKQELQNL